MTRPRTLPLGLTLTALALSANPGPAADPMPADREVSVGTVQRVPAVSVSLAVGNMDKDTKRVVYSPPPGWYVRSHQVKLGERSGLASYTVSTVAAGWQFRSSEQTAGTTHSKVTGQVSSHKISLGGTGEINEDRTTTGEQNSRASHNAIVVDVEAQGGGFLRGGASIDLTVTAELVYLGPRAMK